MRRAAAEALWRAGGFASLLAVAKKIFTEGNKENEDPIWIGSKCLTISERAGITRQIEKAMRGRIALPKHFRAKP